ncbi:MAG: hypothetical protein ABIH23_12970 [bacterium]
MIDASVKLDSVPNSGNVWDPPGILAKYDIYWDDYIEHLTNQDLTADQTYASCTLSEQ